MIRRQRVEGLKVEGRRLMKKRLFQEERGHPARMSACGATGPHRPIKARSKMKRLLIFSLFQRLIYRPFDRFAPTSESFNSPLATMWRMLAARV